MKKISFLFVVLATLVALLVPTVHAAKCDRPGKCGVWEKSTFGEFNGFGLGVYPGQEVNMLSLDWWWWEEDFTDLLYYPPEIDEKGGYRWCEWEQSGFSGRVVAAKATIVHAGYDAGRLFILQEGRRGEMKKILVGKLTRSDAGGVAICTLDEFDLSWARLRPGEPLQFRLEIDFREGGFPNDTGVIDAVEVEAYVK